MHDRTSFRPRVHTRAAPPRARLAARGRPLYAPPQRERALTDHFTAAPALLITDRACSCSLSQPPLCLRLEVLASDEAGSVFARNEQYDCAGLVAA